MEVYKEPCGCLQPIMCIKITVGKISEHHMSDAQVPWWDISAGQSLLSHQAVGNQSTFPEQRPLHRSSCSPVTMAVSKVAVLLLAACAVISSVNAAAFVNGMCAAGINLGGLFRCIHC